MPCSRHLLAPAAVVAFLLSGCAATAPAPATYDVTTVARAGAHSGVAFALPTCDALPREGAPALADADRRCDQGDANACFDASLRYVCGAGVPRDDRAAAERADRACGGGNVPSCATAGALFLRSIDPQDQARAMHALLSGCSGSSGDACNNLAVAMTQGIGTPVDERGALYIFDRLCKQGYDGSCRNAATVREDLRREAALFAPPCEGDHPCISVVIAQRDPHAK
jgi:TPR repeat protein